MSYDKTMNFLIFDGNPNGLIMGELSNWNGRVYKIARNALATLRIARIISTPVYIFCLAVIRT